jgi:NADH dehydrogenase [ubiquinone] 1 alpha subcomplex assembly factor 1
MVKDAMIIKTAGVRQKRAPQVLLICLAVLSLGATDPESPMSRIKASITTDLEAAKWVPVNDTVMGGRSQSTLRVDAARQLVWSGVLSLENNGGFVSIRSPGGWDDWTDYDGVEVVVEAAGRDIQVSLQRADGVVRAGGYRAVLPSTNEGETSVFIPFSAFVLTQFGRRISGPPLRSGLKQVGQRGLLIADKKEGPFRVTVKSFRPAQHSDETRINPLVRNILVEAINRGVPLFNAGDHEACRLIYQQVLEDAVAEGQFGRRTWSHRIVQDALLLSREQAPTEAAWTLRGAIDGVLRVLAD